MITRRSVVVSSSLAMALRGTIALAQSSEIPTIEELSQALSDRARYRKVLVNVDLLRLLLIAGLWDKYGPPKDADLQMWLAVRRPFESEAYPKQVVDSLAKSKDIVDAAAKTAQPISRKIEGFLNEVGVSAEKPTSRETLHAFYIFIQMKAVAENQKEDHWYCKTYPFSWFCNTG